jgi:hypothetical protein
MKSFLQHISEDYDGSFLELFLEEAGNAGNDTNGKLAEIHSGEFLANEATHPDNAGGTLADFRSKEGYDRKTGRTSKTKSGSPAEIRKKLETKAGPEQAAIVRKHAQFGMQKFLEHARRHGIIPAGHEIHQVAWTSLPDRENAPGDHEKMTGKKDVTATGDVMFSLRNKKTKKVTGYRAVSMKYGTQSPNLSNPGLESLEKISNSKPGELTSHYQDHIERMGQPHKKGGLAYSGSGVARHAQYKVDKMSTIEEAQSAHDHLQGKVDAGEKLDSNHKQRLEELKTHISTYKKLKSKAAKQSYLDGRAERGANAEQSSLDTRKAMVGTMLTNLAKKGVRNKPPVTAREQQSNARGDQHLRNMLKTSISPPSVTPHTVVHIIPNKDPTKDPRVNIHSREEHADKHLDQFDHLHAVQQGVSMVIKGRHKVTGRVVPVATYSLKNGDGPHMGMNGTLKNSHEVHEE